jgi:HEAT repeat protein
VIVARCGLVENPDEVVISILADDPALAGRCVASGVLLDPDTRRKTVDRLVDTLGNAPWPVAGAMAEALRRLGDPGAAPGLVAMLRGGPLRINGPIDTRELAALALGGGGGPLAMAGLTEALRCESKGLRVRAARSLGRLGDPAAIPDLVGVLWDDEQVPLYFSTTVSLQEAAGQAPVRIGERAPAAVIPAMLDGLRSLEPRVRAACAHVLASVGDRSAVRGLLDALRYDVDSRVTYAAHTALGRLRDAGAVPQLLDALRDPDARARAASAQALGSIADLSAVRGLLDALAYDVDGNVRATSARALGRIADASSADGLRAALNDASDQVRESAGQAIAELQRTSAT